MVGGVRVDAEGVGVVEVRWLASWWVWWVDGRVMGDWWRRGRLMEGWVAGGAVGDWRGGG